MHACMYIMSFANAFVYIYIYIYVCVYYVSVVCAIDVNNGCKYVMHVHIYRDIMQCGVTCGCVPGMCVCVLFDAVSHMRACIYVRMFVCMSTVLACVGA